LGTLVGAIGEQFLKKWKFPEQRAQDEKAAIAILNVRAMNDGVKQQAQSIDKNMPPFSFDLLAGVIAMGIDMAPPLWMARIVVSGSTIGAGENLLKALSMTPLDAVMARP
jgi:hypothetical protein